MARQAERITGLPVAVSRFQEMAYVEEFDGIWANASLLHVSRQEMGDGIARLTRALRPGGILYTSFKVGESEGFRDGRFFNDWSEPRLRELFNQ
jgi:hypothetical protein